MGTALSELRIITFYLSRASTGLMPTPWATSLLLLQLGSVRKEDQCQIKKLNTPVRSFFALWQSVGEVPYSDGLVLSQLALPAQGKSRGKFKDLSADVHTGLQGQPGQGFMSKILQQELRDFTQPVD